MTMKEFERSGLKLSSREKKLVAVEIAIGVEVKDMGDIRITIMIRLIVVAGMVAVV